MPTKPHSPHLNQKLARFKLRIRRSRIERFGVFTEETIPPGKRVIQYTGERISHREAMRRTVRMFLAGKAGRVYLVRLNRRWSLDGSVGGSGAEFINHGCDPNLTMRRIRGQVFLYSGRPGWLYLTVGAGAGNGTLICQLEGRDGRRITVGSFRLTGGYGHWGRPEPLPPAAVTSARLTTEGGKALATASFSPPG